MEKDKKKHILNIFFLIGITVVVLYFSLKDDFDAIVHQLQVINLWWLALAFLCVIAYWLIRSKAVNIFTRKFKPETKYRSSLQLMIRTQFFNAVTPFASGGQPYQVYYLVKNKIKATTATSIIIQNFIVYQIAMVFLGTVAVIINHFCHFYKKIALLQKLVTLGFAINFAVIVVLFIVAFSEKLNKKLISFGITVLTKLHIVKDKKKKLAEWDEYIENFHSSAEILLENKKSFMFTILLNVVALIILYSIPYVLLKATGDFSSFKLYEAIITSAYVMLIGSFVPIPGGSGGLEYGFIAFYGNFISGPQLMAIMLLWRFVTYYFGMFVGAISLNLKQVK